MDFKWGFELWEELTDKLKTLKMAVCLRAVRFYRSLVQHIVLHLGHFGGPVD